MTLAECLNLKSTAMYTYVEHFNKFKVKLFPEWNWRATQNTLSFFYHICWELQHLMPTTTTHNHIKSFKVLHGALPVFFYSSLYSNRMKVFTEYLRHFTVLSVFNVNGTHIDAHRTLFSLEGKHNVWHKLEN